MIEDFHRLSPYSLKKIEKEHLLLRELKELTEMHRERCAGYGSYLDAVGYGPDQAKALYEIPPKLRSSPYPPRIPASPSPRF